MKMPKPSPLQLLEHPLLAEQHITLYLKRDDLLHPTIPGNKWRKLKYNLEAAQAQQQHTLLTFGGAYSNHLAAVAAAGQEFGFNTIGLVRGEEHLPLNPTLSFATDCGMTLHYLDRETYRHKNEPDFLKTLQKRFGSFYLLPEGGTNTLAVKGCAEIVTELDQAYDYLCSPCGTGGTLSGLIAGAAGKGRILGFPALKGGGFLVKEVTELLQQYNGKSYSNWELITDYHFGGYAKVKPELLAFIQWFREQFNILLDPVYTGKMLFGMFDLLQKGFFRRGSTIIALHTGGLQGWSGMEERLGIALPN